MTRIDLSRLSPRHQSLIRKHQRLSEINKKPKAKKSKPTAFDEEFDSQLELDFAEELELWRLEGHISEWRYHPMRFRLARCVTYEPDFLRIPLSSLDAAQTFYEVKGSWKMKNARDSRTRLEACASLNWWFKWQAVTLENGIWRYETI